MKTDPQLFEIFFADLLLPLHQANRRHNDHYFALGPDGTKESYWEPVTPRAPGGLERLRIGEGDGADLLARLTDYWAESGEALLPRLRPDLEALWHTLMESDEAVGEPTAEVSVTVYPLF